MSQELAKREETGIMQSYTGEQVQLIKDTVAKGATDNELKLFLYQANKTGLDPLAKQIYCIRRWSNSANAFQMTIQTGIDGYRLIADRTGLYAGNDDPVFDEDGENIRAATVTVYKIVQGLRCPFTATARWSEYYPGEKQGMMWKKMGHVMLGKCAEGLALRKAFPGDLSGIYTDAEMQQADAAEHKPAQTTTMGKAAELPPAPEVLEPEIVEPQANAPAAPVQPPAEPPKAKGKTKEKTPPAAEPEASEPIIPTDRTLSYPVMVGGKEILTAGITQEQVLTISALQKRGTNKAKIQGFLDAQKVTGLRFLTELEGKVILGLIDNPIAANAAMEAQINRFWAIVAELKAKDGSEGIKAMLSKMFSKDNAAAASLHAFTVDELTAANDFLSGFKGNAQALAATLAAMNLDK
jgi:phage recombination protein Bet